MNNHLDILNANIAFHQGQAMTVTWNSHHASEHDTAVHRLWLASAFYESALWRFKRSVSIQSRIHDSVMSLADLALHHPEESKHLIPATGGYLLAAQSSEHVEKQLRTRLVQRNGLLENQDQIPRWGVKSYIPMAVFALVASNVTELDLEHSVLMGRWLYMMDEYFRQAPSTHQSRANLDATRHAYSLATVS